jgi:hypothetical protein
LTTLTNEVIVAEFEWSREIITDVLWGYDEYDEVAFW